MSPRMALPVVPAVRARQGKPASGRARVIAAPRARPLAFSPEYRVAVRWPPAAAGALFQTGRKGTLLRVAVGTGRPHLVGRSDGRHVGRGNGWPPAVRPACPSRSGR